MRTVWKVALTLGLVLPMVAYVAGSLAASRSEEPAPRETIVIRDAPGRAPSDRPSSAPGGDDRRDDRKDRDDREKDEVDDNGVRVVSPRPTPLDESEDDADDDRDGRSGQDDSTERDGDDDGGASRDD